MSRSSYLFLISIILLVSCKPIYKSVNGINKTISFEDISSYKDYVSKKTKLDLTKIVLVKNENFDLLISNIQKNKIVYYYGIIENDSLIASGSSLKEKNTCYGSILTTINDNLYTTLNFSVVDHKNIIDKLSLINLFDKHFDYNRSKKTVIFIYSYKLGRLVSNITDIISELRNSSVDYFIISIDNPSILKLY